MRIQSCKWVCCNLWSRSRDCLNKKCKGYMNTYHTIENNEKINSRNSVLSVKRPHISKKRYFQ